MRKVLALLAAIFISISIFAQSPERMSYQAIIRNSSNQLIVNQNIGLRISILQDSLTGNAVFVETQTPTTNANGLISIAIGEGTIVKGNFAVINWATGPYFIKTETDPTGSTNYSITAINQLLSVPYALHAKTAESITTQTIIGAIDANNSVIKNLASPVNSTDAANKAYVDSSLEKIEILLGTKVKDMDGNVYNTLTIGTQLWMSVNLKTTKFNDGSEIPLITDNLAWSNLTASGYCWYKNDKSTFGNTYGAIYNWYTVNTGKLCPTGWRVPTDADWDSLISYLGGETDAGGKLRENGTTHWLSPNTGANNETGFTALPGGNRNSYDGIFDGVRLSGVWWSATEFSISSAWVRDMLYYLGPIYKDFMPKSAGFSVRCVKN